MKQVSMERPFLTFVKAMALLGLLGTVLLATASLRDRGLADWYLLWNLFLAWVPLILAYALVRHLRHHAWSSWTGIGMSLTWLLFLPNSFYIVSDLIHLDDMPRANVLFDALTFTLFVLNGLILGYVSLYLVQSELGKRIGRWRSEAFALAMLLLSSFAIYLGRELRWNSWDAVASPAGILFDVSERFIDPLDYPATYTTTLMFFVFLSGLYAVIRLAVRAIGSYARMQKHWP